MATNTSHREKNLPTKPHTPRAGVVHLHAKACHATHPVLIVIQGSAAHLQHTVSCTAGCTTCAVRCTTSTVSHDPSWVCSQPLVRDVQPIDHKSALISRPSCASQSDLNNSTNSWVQSPPVPKWKWKGLLSSARCCGSGTETHRRWQ